MKTFNINRFWKVFTRLLLVRRREIVKWTVCMAGIMLFFLLIRGQVWDFTAYSNDILLAYYIVPVNFIAFFLSFFILNYGCYITSDLENKQARISELMLPSTPLEKYLARLAYTSVVFLLMVVVALVCADILQQGITMLVHGGARVSIIALLWDMISTSNSYLIWMSFSLYLLANATVVLGGVIFRKSAWLKMWIAVGIITVFFLFLTFLFVSYIYTETDYEIYIPDSKEIIEVVVNLCLITISLVFYYLAYKVYSRLQVINNRWINL